MDALEYARKMAKKRRKRVIDIDEKTYQARVKAKTIKPQTEYDYTVFYNISGEKVLDEVWTETCRGEISKYYIDELFKKRDVKVMGYRDKDSIIAIVFFEKRGKSHFIHLLCANKKYANAGSKLLDLFEKRKDTKVVNLEAVNKKVASFYESRGYTYTDKEKLQMEKNV